MKPILEPSTWLASILGALTLFTVRSLHAQTNSCDPPPSWLISWWPGNGNAADIIGTNNGTLENGVTFGPGEVGEAFSFDGNSGYVQVGGSFDISGSRTIEGWVYANTNTGYGLPIFVAGATGAGDFFGIGGTTSSCGIPQYSLYVDHWGEGCFYNGSITVVPNTWTHVALTYDASGPTLVFYVNGVAEPGISASLYNYNLNTATLGGNNIGGTTTKPTFNGLINQLSFYDRALTSNEIAAIYNAGSAGKCLLSPNLTSEISGANFGFNVPTISNLIYTIQQNTNLATTNWVVYTNFTGNGSRFQFVTPVLNVPQQFFRVGQK